MIAKLNEQRNQTGRRVLKVELVFGPSRFCEGDNFMCNLETTDISPVFYSSSSDPPASTLVSD